MLPRPRVLVVGDVMIDVYKHCSDARVSPEAPAIIGRVMYSESFPGGAANVAANLCTLGADVHLVGVGESDLLDCLPVEMEESVDLLPPQEGGTITKTRFMIDNKQVFREDVEPVGISSHYASWKHRNAVLAKVEGLLESWQPDVLVISDYCKGMLQFSSLPTDLRQMLRLQTGHEPLTFVDTKNPDLSSYKDTFCLKINQKELDKAQGFIDYPACTDSKAILKANNIGNIVVTRGSAGMLWMTPTDTRDFPSVLRRTVVDVTGAGDTVLASLAYIFGLQKMCEGYLDLYYSMGLKDLCKEEQPFCSALKFASHAAAIAVSEPGTTKVHGAEVRAACGGPNGKIFTKSNYDAFCELRQCWKDRDYEVAMTNGCFDILHPGHMYLLSECAKLGDKVVVALNSDESVKSLKGAERPVVGWKDRAKMLASMENVDAVVVFDGTPEESIMFTMPDYLVKGSEYKGKTILGADHVRRYGGKVILVDMLQDCSTTRIVNKMNPRSVDNTGT